jgi:hypothetical protein
MKLRMELYDALELLMQEIEFSGNGNAKDFGWPKALEAARKAMARYKFEHPNG